MECSLFLMYQNQNFHIELGEAKIRDACSPCTLAAAGLANLK